MNAKGDQTTRVPIPDPTELTTRALLREIAALKEVFEVEIQSIAKLHESNVNRLSGDINLTRQVLETRLHGMDVAIELLKHSQNDQMPERVPILIDEKIEALRGVQEEKFRSIAVQFAERDTRTEQTSRDSKVAVDAALQAAKEAVAEQNRSSALAIAKSEASTVKQIDQQAVLIQTTAKASDDKIDDIKIRLTRIEGKGEGEAGSTTTRQSSITTTAVVIGVVIALGEVLAIIFRK